MIKLKKINPVHPGEILMEEFIAPFSLSQTQLAKSIQVSPRRINEIVQGKRSISACLLTFGLDFKWIMIWILRGMNPASVFTIKFNGAEKRFWNRKNNLN